MRLIILTVVSLLVVLVVPLVDVVGVVFVFLRRVAFAVAADFLVILQVVIVGAKSVIVMYVLVG